ncbi:hypothetical protein Ahy_A05g025440 isoform B [Arachis hypogaea]|uniref:Uncharacterized protein n=1 Tax=Arachis hypogaea TaxID=3818 RepID=A0A445D8P4_ARAHY|nr:hypothetical protein Ahy_A05g025440 isoform B [Arachis hypogaea]
MLLRPGKAGPPPPAKTIS